MGFIRRIALWFSRREDADSPQRLYLILQRAHAHLQLEEYDRARALLLEVIASRHAISDPNVVAYTLNALDATYIFTEQYQDGITFFSEYIGRHSDDPDAYSGRAACLWYKEQYQDAIRDYSRALTLDPSHVLSLSGRGQVLTEAGDYTRTIEDLDSALTALKPATASNPDRAKWYEQIEAFVHNGRALALAGLGDLGAAEEEFEHSIRLSPGNAWVYHNRGKAYDRAGDVGRAAVEYRMALTKKDPALSALRRKHAEERLSQWAGKG